MPSLVPQVHFVMNIIFRSYILFRTCPICIESLSHITWPHPSKGFPCGSAVKESTCSAGDLSLIPGLGRAHGEGKGYPLRILAWRIPWTVQSMGSQRVGHG